MFLPGMQAMAQTHRPKGRFTENLSHTDLLVDVRKIRTETKEETASSSPCAADSDSQ